MKLYYYKSDYFQGSYKWTPKEAKAEALTCDNPGGFYEIIEVKITDRSKTIFNLLNNIDPAVVGKEKLYA
jgi:hypothetical protein|tara:strand:- start:243 stop:452 length:210 start_codon:yes stop_codon:yes gene_type:complete